MKISIKKIPLYLHRLTIEFVFFIQRIFINIYIFFIYDKIKKFNDKIVVYTAITSGKDVLKKFKKTKGITYICFSDNLNLKSDLWDIRKINIIENNNPRLNAKHPKILPHKYFTSFEYSVWIDGSIVPKIDIRYLIYKYLKNSSIAFFKHYMRNCIYKEADTCIKLGKGNHEVIKQQMALYQKKQYPKNNGLIAGTIIFRKHNDKKVIKVMEDWWKEIINHSIRDQLSFNYVAYKNKFFVNIINKNLYSNCYFSMVTHKINSF